MPRALPKEWIDYLVSQPESGMGYQRVDVSFDDGLIVENCLALNAEEIELPATCLDKTITSIRLHHDG